MSKVKVCRLSNWIWLPSLIFLLSSVHFSAVSFGSSWHLIQDGEQEKEASEQEVLSVEILVQDSEGRPVVDATVTPWALACSTGHGLWSAKANGGVEPTPVTTDAKGIANVAYPKFAKLDERVSTTAVSVSVNHPEHPYVSGVHINVPPEKTYQFGFPAGASLEIRALVDGVVDTSEHVHIVSTSGRPAGKRAAATSEGVIQVPPMAEGKGQLLLVRLDGKQPSHFSSLINLEVDPEEGVIEKEIELAPAVAVKGRLSDNVPRPVKNGRVVVSTICPGDSRNEISWRTWAEVNADGTFLIESWPADQPIQLVALCDGFCAESGEKPPMVGDNRRRANRILRPQAFMKPADTEIVVQMTPLVDCHIEIKDAFGKPISNVIVAASPNVGWWNSGTQIYCYPLMRSAEWLLTGKYEPESQEGLFAFPFQSVSDEQGKARMQLPAGRRSLFAYNEKYQLPIKVGRRSEKIEVKAGDSMDISLVVQPKGLEVLGDWEDLCGLVFG